MWESIIALLSEAAKVTRGANTVLGMYRNMTAIVRGNQPLNKLEERLKQLDEKVNRLSPDIIYVPYREGVRNLNHPCQRPSLEPKEIIRVSLEPIQESLGDSLVSSHITSTPERLELGTSVREVILKPKISVVLSHSKSLIIRRSLNGSRPINPYRPASNPSQLDP